MNVGPKQRRSKDSAGLGHPGPALGACATWSSCDSMRLGAGDWTDPFCCPWKPFLPGDGPETDQSRVKRTEG